MTRDELTTIIQKELADNSKATSIEIAKKYKIPFHIVEVFIRRILKG